MRGDILFWPAADSLSERIIARFTRGPFVHVSVDMGDGTDIGAHSEDGTRRHPTPDVALLTVYRLPDGVYRLERGIAFLTGEIGQPYGYSNVVNVVLRALHLPYRVSRLGHWDCSALVAHYLQHIGLDLSDEPDSLSPNDLARSLGVIK